MHLSFDPLRRAFLITAALLLLTHNSVLSPVYAQEQSPTEKIQKSTQIAERIAQMVAQLETAGDPSVIEKALELAQEASDLISDVIAAADMKEDKELVLAALDLTTSLDASIAQIKGIALNVAQTTTESDVAETVARLIQLAENLTLNHANMIKAAAEHGFLPRAEGYQPPQNPSFDVPFSEEPPIQDTLSASPV